MLTVAASHVPYRSEDLANRLHKPLSMTPSVAKALEHSRRRAILSVEDEQDLARRAAHGDHAAGDRLDQRERTLFKARWLNESPITLAGFAVGAGISREQARQLEQRMMTRLRARFIDRLSTSQVGL